MKPKNSKLRLVTLDDGTVLTLRQFADRVGVSYQTLYNYMIVRGMTPEQALAKYKSKNVNIEKLDINRRFVKLDDNTVLTLRQFADTLNVSYQTLYNYMVVRGKTVEQAITKYKSPKYKEGNKGKKHNGFLVVTFDGITTTLPKHCERLGLNYNTVFVRIKRGCTPEQALLAGQRLIKRIMYLGREWTFAELAEYANIPIATFRARLNTGWSLAEACGDAPRGIMVEYEGRWYSISTLSKMTGINYAILYSRLFQQGWTVDEVINGCRAEKK